MENNFLEAFENSNTLQEKFGDTFKENFQVWQQNKANAEKQNAANVNADVANKNGYQQIIASLQKVANEQVQFDEKSIDKYITNINNLKSLDDKSKKQINQMLNQQKTALQQAAALNAQANQINGQLNQKANPQEANQQEAQANQQTENQTNALDDLTLAKNLNDIVANALKLAGEGLTNAQNQQMQKNADKAAVNDVPNTTAETQTEVTDNGGK